jgi:hypothetical protein
MQNVRAHTCLFISVHMCTLHPVYELASAVTHNHLHFFERLSRKYFEIVRD